MCNLFALVPTLLRLQMFGAIASWSVLAAPHVAYISSLHLCPHGIPRDSMLAGHQSPRGCEPTVG